MHTTPQWHPYKVSHPQLKAQQALAGMPEPYFALTLEFLTLSFDSTGNQPWSSFNANGLLIPEIMVTVLRSEREFPYTPLTTLPPPLITQYNVLEYMHLDLIRVVLPQPRVYATKQLKTWHGETLIASGDAGVGKNKATSMQIDQQTLVFNTGSNWNHDIPVAVIGHAESERFDDGWFLWVPVDDAVRFAAWLSQQTLFQVETFRAFAHAHQRAHQQLPSLDRIQELVMAAARRPDSPEEQQQAAFIDQLRAQPRQPGVIGLATPDTPPIPYTPSDPEAFRRSPIGAHLRVSNKVEAKDRTEALFATAGNWLEDYRTFKRLQDQGHRVDVSLKQKVEARPDLIKLLSLIPQQKAWEDQYQNNGTPSSGAPLTQENPMSNFAHLVHPGQLNGQYPAHQPTAPVTRTPQELAQLQAFIRAQWNARTPVNYINDANMNAVAIPQPEYQPQETPQGKMVWVISRVPGYQDINVQLLLDDWIICYLAQYGEPNFSVPAPAPVRPIVPISAGSTVIPSQLDQLDALDALAMLGGSHSIGRAETPKEPISAAQTPFHSSSALADLASLEDLIVQATASPAKPAEDGRNEAWEAELYKSLIGEHSGLYSDGVPVLRLSAYAGEARKQESTHRGCINDVTFLELDHSNKLVRAVTPTGVYTQVSPLNGQQIGSDYHEICKAVMNNRVRRAKAGMVSGQKIVTGLEARPVPKVTVLVDDDFGLPTAQAPAPAPVETKPAASVVEEITHEFKSIIPPRVSDKSEEGVKDESNIFYQVNGSMGLWTEERGRINVLGRYYVDTSDSYEVACGKVAKEVIGGKRYLQMSRQPELVPRAGYLAYGDTCSYIGNTDWNTLPPASEILVDEEEVADIAPWLAAPRDAYYDIPRKVVISPMVFFEWLNTVKKLYLEAGYHGAHDPMWVLNQMKRADDGLKYVKLPDKKAVVDVVVENLPEAETTPKAAPRKKLYVTVGIRYKGKPSTPKLVEKITEEIKELSDQVDNNPALFEDASDVFIKTPDVDEGEDPTMVPHATQTNVTPDVVSVPLRVGFGEGNPDAGIGESAPVVYGSDVVLAVDLLNDIGELASNISRAVVSEGGLVGLREVLRERELNAVCGDELLTADREVLRGIYRLDAAIARRLNMLHRRHGVYTNITSFLGEYDEIEGMVRAGLEQSSYSEVDADTVLDSLTQAYQEFVEAEIEASMLTPCAAGRIVIGNGDFDSSEVDGDSKLNASIALGELSLTMGIDVPYRALDVWVEHEVVRRVSLPECDSSSLKTLLELASKMLEKANNHPNISKHPAQRARHVQVLFMDEVMLIQPSAVEVGVYCVSLL